MTGMNKNLKGAILTAFGGMCWGLSGSVGQFLFTAEGMDSRWLVPVRLGLAGVCLLAYGLKRWGKEVFRPWRERTDRRDLVIYGLLGISCCQFFYFLTIQLSGAATATILQNVSPVFILLAECRIARRLPDRAEILSIILALAGIWLITTHGKPALQVSGAAVVTGVLSALCVTVYNCWPRRLLSRYPVLLLQGWAFLMGGAVFAAVFRIWTYAYIPSLTGAAGIAFVVLVGNVLAFTSYMQGIRLIGPQRGILYSFFEPLTAAAVTALVLHTTFTAADLLGFAAVFVMLAVISLHQKTAG